MQQIQQLKHSDGTGGGILFLGSVDWANLMCDVAWAINRACGVDGFTIESPARVWVDLTHPFGYPQDIHSTNTLPLELIEMVDAGLFSWIVATDHDYTTVFLKAHLLGMFKSGKQQTNPYVAINHCGIAYRKQSELLDAQDLQFAQARFISPDCFGLTPRTRHTVPLRNAWGPLVDQLRPSSLQPLKRAEDGRYHVVLAHSPSNNTQKGTELILPALQAIANDAEIAKHYQVEIDLIRGVPFTEAIERKSRCHIFVDQIAPEVGGYGQSSIEAMAFGAVTLADIHCVPQSVGMHFARPPIHHVLDTHDIVDWIKYILLTDPPCTLNVYRKHAWAWSERNSSPDVVANYWVDTLADAMKR